MLEFFAKKQPEVKSYFVRDHVGALSAEIHYNRESGLVETIDLAMNSFGFLIRRNERVLPSQFAAIIRGVYDCEGNLQNKAVVAALEKLH